MTKIEICPFRAILGEGALWHAKKNVLLWVDILSGTFNTFNPRTGLNRSIRFPGLVGTVVIANDGVLLAINGGVYYLDVETLDLKLCVQLETKEGIRLNDGKCDPQGRFWVGSMHVEPDSNPGAGRLFTVDADFNVTVAAEGVSISNGIVWFDNTMYFIDTPTNKIDAFDHDPATGKVSNRRTIAVLPDEFKTGGPDGMTVDSEGHLWVAIWGGSCVLEINRESGEILRRVEIPAADNITSVAFGGENLDVLYVTSASIDSDVGKNENSGRLFRIRGLGAKGLPPPSFAGHVSFLSGTKDIDIVEVTSTKFEFS